MRVYLIQQLISLELGSFMASLRQGSFVLIYNIIGVFLSILACLLGVYFYGFVGAAIGGCFMTALAMSIDVFRISVVLEKNIASIQQWRSLLVLLFSSCVAGLLSMLTVNSFAFSSTILRLLSAIVILFGLYLFFLKCFNHWWIVDKILGRRGTDG
jgi:O-antigen/teichoic acid export membrane protein